jgi:hypothetical protein
MAEGCALNAAQIPAPRKKDPGIARVSPTGRIPHHYPDAEKGWN